MNNVNNAISFNQTQDGYLQQVDNALNRMSELAIAAQDVTKIDSDRALYQQEFNTLANYINRRVHQGLQRRQPVQRQQPQCHHRQRCQRRSA